jgi:hypothetical protein
MRNCNTTLDRTMPARRREHDPAARASLIAIVAGRDVVPPVDTGGREAP